MKYTKKKLLMMLTVFLITLVIAVIGFKVIVLDENAGIDQAKSVRYLGLEEERKIFGLEENEEYQRLAESARNQSNNNN